MSKSIFSYFYTKQAMGDLEVEDIGKCCIQACNDEGMIWYLLIETNMGWTKICEYGPCTPDFFELPKSVYCSFSRIEYNEGKIEKRIDEFLNSKMRNITQAIVVDREVMFSDCKSILEYCENYDSF